MNPNAIAELHRVPHSFKSTDGKGFGHASLPILFLTIVAPLCAAAGYLLWPPLLLLLALPALVGGLAFHAFVVALDEE
jgi:hypothetical protein